MAVEECEIGILFGDVSGSTRLYELIGDSRAHSAINGALDLMIDTVRRNSGVVVKTVGDEVMAAFFRPTPMFEAALEMQRRAAAQPAIAGMPDGSRLKLRIGMHFGASLRTGGDYHGNTVNVAARMVALAKGDEIIAAGDLKKLLDQTQQQHFRALDTVRFRGLVEETAIAEIVWQSAPNLTQMPMGLRTTPPSRPVERLHLAYRDQSWTIDTRDPPFLIGREPENTLCIPDSRVSRRHATIERRLSNWVLADHSSNGSFISLPHNRSVTLRREEFILYDSGRIAFGSLDVTPDIEPLSFSIRPG